MASPNTAAQRVSDYNKNLIAAVDLITGFCRNLRDEKMEGELISIKNKISLAKSANRNILIYTSGAVIFKYQSYIINKNLESLTDGEIMEEKQNIISKHKVDNDVPVDDLIVAAKKILLKLNENEKNELYSLLNNMRVAYVQYLIYIKKNSS